MFIFRLKPNKRALLAHAIIRADTPGLVSCDLTSFPFQRIAHPVWPLDELQWEPEGGTGS